MVKKLDYYRKNDNHGFREELMDVDVLCPFSLVDHFVV